MSARGASLPGALGEFPASWAAYWTDAWQRSVLFWDTLRQRGNDYRAQQQKQAPHVLKFACTLVLDGRSLQRPVNYGLVRIEPPPGVEIDARRRPFVVVDPRAGHGPGIGGFKADSEIGVALRAGHPCYFVGFLPEPVPGQTIEDIMAAEGRFLEEVIARHPGAEGKPAVIGNCQAGWAVMMLAALRPELFGPIVVAGSPLSYWAGVHGKNPMRYSGGMLGGSWLTALVGDLGGGVFDGAWLVSNFENLNLANTWWGKLHNLYAKVDSEPARFLEFEQWWGGHVMLNAEEMQFIVDKLFVGNKLSSSEIVTSEGLRIDLRNIRSPILCFCSKGDNITPPQQALDWILDLYDSVEDIRAHGQTIVYSVHETVGHLGIFVSGSVARKEHEEFASNIDLIDALPPGLYEAVLTPKDASDANADLIAGDYLVRFEGRDLDAIRALGTNSVEDDRRFATAARVSEANLGLYRTYLQPWVRLVGQSGLLSWMPRVHPARLQFELFSDANPAITGLAPLVRSVQAARLPVARDNPFLQIEQAASQQIEALLDSLGALRDRTQEMLFHGIYGSPALQAWAGQLAEGATPRPRPGIDVEHLRAVQRRMAELQSQLSAGGVREAAVRGLIYIRLAEGAADERGLAMLRRLRAEYGAGLSLASFKELVREQHALLLLDEAGAIAALPAMLAREPEKLGMAGRALRQVVDAVGIATEAGKARAARLEDIFRSAAAARSGPTQSGPILPQLLSLEGGRGLGRGPGRAR